MTATLTQTPLTEILRERVAAFDVRLRKSPFYSRLLEGRVTRQEYADWLAQQHKYVRYSENLVRQLARAMAEEAQGDPVADGVYKYARWEYQEEALHDELVVEDLAALWNVSLLEARGRIESAPTAPSILTYSRIRDVMLNRAPKGVLGAVFAMETTATLQADEIRSGLLENSGIEGISQAVRFWTAHRAEVEERHAGQAADQINALTSPADRCAVFTFANVAMNMYEGIAFYLSEIHGDGEQA